MTLASNKHDSGLDRQMLMLIESDNVQEWAIRYVFMQHIDNEQFLANYFSPNGQSNMNVRKITQHKKELWNLHNKFIEDSGKNGNLLWRVKIFNRHSESIDYIEVWKNQEIIDNFSSNDVDTIVESNQILTTDQKYMLSRMIYDHGFIARTVNAKLGISKLLAIEKYKYFCDLAETNSTCIINTRLNPKFCS